VRLRRLHARGFGRLAGRTFELAPGLTVAYGPNEAGKSTLHAALVASLFGMTSGRRRTRTETAQIEARRPWTEVDYGATLELALESGRRLRVEWDFDRCGYRVHDAVTGEDLTGRFGGGGDPAALAGLLCAVDRSLYLRIGCVGQASLGPLDGAGEIRTALEAALSRSERDSSAERAIEALRAARAARVGLNRARTNPLPQAERALADATEALERAAAARDAVGELVAERDAARDRAASELGRLRELERTRERARVAALQRLAADVTALERRQAEAERAAAAHAGDSAFVADPAVPRLRDRLEDAMAEPRDADADAARERERALADDEARLAAEAERLAPDRGAAAAESAIEAALGELLARRPRARALQVAALALAGVSAAALVAAGPLVAAAGAALAVALAVAGRLLGRSAASLATVDRHAPSARPGEPLAHRVERFRAAAARDRRLATVERALADVRGRRSELRARLARDDAVRERVTGARRLLAERLAACGIDASDLRAALESYAQKERGAAAYEAAAAEVERARAELDRLLAGRTAADVRAALAAVPADRASAATHAVGPGDVSRLDEAVATQRRRAEEARIRSDRLAVQVDERLRAVPELTTLEEAVAAAQATVDDLHRAERVLKLAEGALAEAATEAYRDFAPRLNAGLEGGLAAVTGGRYRRAFVDDDLTVRLEAPETGRLVGVADLSHGTREQVHLLQRLELVRLLSPPEEPLPVLLDDPFVHCDETRLERAMAFLATVADERQVILFTTQRRVLEVLPAGTAVLALDPPDASDDAIASAA
jgi:uncharacterized protein YhaN